MRRFITIVVLFFQRCLQTQTLNKLHTFTIDYSRLLFAPSSRYAKEFFFETSSPTDCDQIEINIGSHMPATLPMAAVSVVSFSLFRNVVKAGQKFPTWERLDSL